MKIKFLPVHCGDCIVIHFIDKNNVKRNIIIDSGQHHKSIYPKFKSQVEQIIEAGEKIDLFIITHYDEDHIGGIRRLLKDSRFDYKNNINQWWLNHSIPYHTSSQISVKQAIDLKSLLQEIGKCPTLPIIASDEKINIFDVNLSILSPDKKRYERAKKQFDKKETKISLKPNDHKLTIEELSLKMSDFKKDTSIANGSSIAFLLEYNSKRGLFLADAYSDVVEQSLRLSPFFCSNKKQIKVDFVKVSHHGSKHNTSLDLLSLIDCDTFIFSTDGKNRHRLPHKETLVRIIKNSERDFSKKLKLVFNHQDEILENIFSVDDSPYEKYNFEVQYTPADEILTLNF